MLSRGGVDCGPAFFIFKKCVYFLGKVLCIFVEMCIFVGY